MIIFIWMGYREIHVTLIVAEKRHDHSSLNMEQKHSISTAFKFFR